MPYVTLVTLGCPKNQVDSERLLIALNREGIYNTDSVEDAGIILVNTCGFINDAKEESINEVINLAQHKGADKRLVVFGCLSQRYKDELATELPEIDAIWGVGKENEIVRYCKDTLSHGNGVNVSPVQVGVDGARPMYAYIKIAEGCNRPCGYCVIPSIRGGFRSFPAEGVIAEAEACVKAGKKELILIAQDLTSYGKDIGYDLPRIIKDIATLFNLKTIARMITNTVCNPTQGEKAISIPIPKETATFIGESSIPINALNVALIFEVFIPTSYQFSLFVFCIYKD
ncbi:miab-like tRNA modifying enzyme ylig [Candidatus Magnetobacterium bavaricum]|uniref:Miab-like tRNA modifying enzyme ylig n=1 Tax=Candidatus Magnetobacterium bavaricum TaxID=29290 RepID=A0A0F3GIL5_9BACT|nr:miab-like tRNA modifying enzyme ylig [Candidatus Magnetobacterium bavaricum]